MFSFHSDDLNSDIYVTECISQPFNGGGEAYNPLETAIPFDIVGMFESELSEAHTNRHNYDSDTLRVGWVSRNGSKINTMFLVKVSYASSNDEIRVYMGYWVGTGTPPGAPTSWNNYSYSYMDYSTWDSDRARGYIYYFHRRGRDLMVPPPGYDDPPYESIIMTANRLQLYKGTFSSTPSGQYTYGTWNYVYFDRCYMEEPTICTPCQANGPTVADCEEYVAHMWMNQTYADSAVLRVVAEDGSYDPDPDPPGPPTPNDPNEQDPDYPSSPSDPEGDYERDYDPVPIPNTPSDGVADAGFVTIYRMTFREFDEFASKCFADDIWSAIKLKFNNPTDFLVGAMLLPFIPDVGLSYYPKFGLKTLDTAYPRISNQFHDVDCGSVNITKYWGNCFDYEPYTKIQIWLPYIGYKDLPVDEFMGQTISVLYRCDCLTGDCIAFVYTGTVGQTGPQVERVIAQYYGNCGVRVPFGSQSFDAAVAAGITLIGAAAASGLVAAGSAAIGAESGAGVLMSAGQAAGGVATGTVGRAASVGVVQGMKPNVQHGGAAGASGGYMGIQKPYLIRRIPHQSLPEGFMNLKGYPSNIGGKLADFTGLAVVDDIQLNNIPAMEDERKEIIDWLRGGVLI